MGDVLDFESTDAFTLAAWIKTRQATPGATMSIIAKSGTDGANNPGYDMQIFNDAGLPFRFVLRGADASTNEVYPRVNTTDWVHVACTYNGQGVTASNMNCYENGIVLTAASFDNSFSGLMANNGTLRVGDNEQTTQEFDGSIDDPRIYNRALSASEVLQLYNSSRWINR
jgi:hypothetical protein